MLPQIRIESEHLGDVAAAVAYTVNPFVKLGYDGCYSLAARV